MSCWVARWGFFVDGGPLDAKRAVYASGMTYGTGYEFGFDYLREQLENSPAEPVTAGKSAWRSARGHHLATARGRFHADSPSWTRWTACSSTRRARRWCLATPHEAAQTDDRCLSRGHSGGQFVACSRRLRGRSAGALGLAHGKRAKSLLRRAIAGGTAAAESDRGPITCDKHFTRRRCSGREVDYVVADDQVVLVDAMTGGFAAIGPARRTASNGRSQGRVKSQRRGECRGQVT